MGCAPPLPSDLRYFRKAAAVTSRHADKAPGIRECLGGFPSQLGQPYINSASASLVLSARGEGVAPDIGWILCMFLHCPKMFGVGIVFRKLSGEGFGNSGVPRRPPQSVQPRVQVASAAVGRVKMFSRTRTQARSYASNHTVPPPHVSSLGSCVDLAWPKHVWSRCGLFQSSPDNASAIRECSGGLPS